MTLKTIINQFPKNFIFGTATSSYQIEGSGFGNCGESHWDSFSKKANSTFKNQSGLVACNHIQNWAEDLDLVANGGFSAYRFSFSWPRLIKNGKNEINPDGFSFYDRLLDGMLERNLSPFATLYHWDLPKTLADYGGWTNRETSKWFGDYTEKVIKCFGDRLYSVATINEPWCVSWLSHYLGHHAPGLKNLRDAVRSMHFILLAHGEATCILKSLGQHNVGIVLNKQYCQPATQNPEDISASQLNDEIHNLWFDQALFKGSYPSRILALFENHMPVGFENDLTKISQKLDWLGINYYTRSITKSDPTEKILGFKSETGSLPKTDMGWEIFPRGLTTLLERQIKVYSKSLPIYVTENGMANKDKIINDLIDDYQRIKYFELHLDEVRNLINNKAPIKGFFVWSLLDNFEWAFGYDKRFGLVHVNFDSQKRTPKKSYYAFKDALTN